MRTARIEGTSEVIQADKLKSKYPNYKSLTFVCLDEECNVRMSPTCIEDNAKKRPFFKKYRNREHIKECKYAIEYETVEGGNNTQLSFIELQKIGYPSVFDVELDEEDFEEKLKEKKEDESNEGITTNAVGVKKNYVFDEESTYFNRKNKVTQINRIVDWYLQFPHLRDVVIEVEGEKIEYRYFFKKIKEFTTPIELKNKRIFYGVLRVSNSQLNVFDKNDENVFFTLLGFEDIMSDEEFENSKRLSKFLNYNVKIKKENFSKQSLTKLKNQYLSLFNESLSDLKNKTTKPNVYLYVFFYGTLDSTFRNLLNVTKNYITFRYVDVKPTNIEVE